MFVYCLGTRLVITVFDYSPSIVSMVGSVEFECLYAMASILHEFTDPKVLVVPVDRLPAWFVAFFPLKVLIEVYSNSAQICWWRQ